MMRAIEGSTFYIHPTLSRPSTRFGFQPSIAGSLTFAPAGRKRRLIYSPDEQFEIGRAKVIKQSGDDKATIVSSGSLCLKH